jgi:hypothetical protein
MRHSRLEGFLKRAMVAIGVNAPDSTVLPALKAAATGAEDVAKWGESQGFDVALLTDALSPITVSDVFKAVKRFVDAGTYSQLVLYFSGHGVLLSPDSEVWVLSGALANPNETINVRGSIAAARTGRIPHIVVVSDACRSMPSNFLMGSLSPGVVFPTNSPKAPMPEVDIFYATLPGDVAYELPPAEAVARYRGLLTDCMLGALRSEHPALVDQIGSGAESRRVITSRRLKNHLVEAVPAAATAVSIQLAQDPDMRVESDLPKFLAELAQQPSEPPPDMSVATSPWRSSEMIVRRTLQKGRPRPRVLKKGGAKKAGKRPVARAARKVAVPVPAPAVPLARSWQYWLSSLDHSNTTPRQRLPNVAGRNSVSKITASRYIDHFLGFTGIVVSVIDVIGIRVTGFKQPCSLRLIGGSIHSSVDHSPKRGVPPRSALIRFVDGSCVVVSVLPGYIASVIAEEGRVLTVNYTPSRSNPGEYAMFEYSAREIEESRALVATLARHGSLRFEAHTMEATARFLRKHKRVDPTLGLFAAYAYFEAGLADGVSSVYQYMRGDPFPLLFDVALLKMQVPMTDGVKAPRNLNFAPWLPVLTQGWMLLGKAEEHMPKPLKQARRFLKPGLWTTFMKEGADILEAAMFGPKL